MYGLSNQVSASHGVYELPFSGEGERYNGKRRGAVSPNGRCSSVRSLWPGHVGPIGAGETFG